MDIVETLDSDVMVDVENNMVVSASIVSSELIFTKKNGSTINAGSVVGEEGQAGGGSIVDYWYSNSFINQLLPTGMTYGLNLWFESSSNRGGNQDLFEISSTGVDNLTVKFPGWYRLELGVSMTPSTAGRRIPMIYVNGVEIRRKVYNSVSYALTPVDTYVYLNQYDVITCYFYQDTASNMNTIEGSPYGYFFGIKLS